MSKVRLGSEAKMAGTPDEGDRILDEFEARFGVVPTLVAVEHSGEQMLTIGLGGVRRMGVQRVLRQVGAVGEDRTTEGRSVE